MLSSGAKSAVDQWFMKALRQSLAADDGSSCRICVDEPQAHSKQTKVVMLTSSSYVFRVFSLIYFDLDETTRQHFASRIRCSGDAMSHQQFIDAICECANMCVGSLNRELGKVYRHIGLSTPNILEAQSARHLDSLKSGLLRHYRIEINGVNLFRASLCVCEFEDMHFSVPSEALATESEVENGELEMF